MKKDDLKLMCIQNAEKIKNKKIKMRPKKEAMDKNSPNSPVE
jgi:hypothetical protein